MRQVTLTTLWGYSRHWCREGTVSKSNGDRDVSPDDLDRLDHLEHPDALKNPGDIKSEPTSNLLKNDVEKKQVGSDQNANGANKENLATTHLGQSVILNEKREQGIPALASACGYGCGETQEADDLTFKGIDLNNNLNGLERVEVGSNWIDDEERLVGKGSRFVGDGVDHYSDEGTGVEDVLVDRCDPLRENLTPSNNRKLTEMWQEKVVGKATKRRTILPMADVSVGWRQTTSIEEGGTTRTTRNGNAAGLKKEANYEKKEFALLSTKRVALRRRASCIPTCCVIDGVIEGFTTPVPLKRRFSLPASFERAEDWCTPSGSIVNKDKFNVMPVRAKEVFITPSPSNGCHDGRAVASDEPMNRKRIRDEEEDSATEDDRKRTKRQTIS